MTEGYYARKERRLKELDSILNEFKPKEERTMTDFQWSLLIALATANVAGVFLIMLLL